MEESVLKGR